MAPFYITANLFDQPYDLPGPLIFRLAEGFPDSAHISPRLRLGFQNETPISVHAGDMPEDITARYPVVRRHRFNHRVAVYDEEGLYFVSPVKTDGILRVEYDHAILADAGHGTVKLVICPVPVGISRFDLNLIADLQIADAPHIPPPKLCRKIKGGIEPYLLRPEHCL
jgi:hypothetical protein